MTHNPIICAIDTTDIDYATALARQVVPHVGAIKLGLEFFVANGAQGVRAFETLNVPIFLDLKFHDIPNTVAKAIEATAGLHCFMMTVHCCGGKDMLVRAVEASRNVAKTTGQPRPHIIGVTVLTSMDDDDLHGVGVPDATQHQVNRLATLAHESALDGMVCSSHEIALLRAELGDAPVLVVPGIRPEGSKTDDQKRIMTPHQAVQLGATHLVIGRPITNAANPAQAARAISQSLGL